MGPCIQTARLDPGRRDPYNSARSGVVGSLLTDREGDGRWKSPQEAAAEVAMLMGTDMEVGIRMGVSGLDVEAPGNILLPIDRFIAFIATVSGIQWSISARASAT